MRSGAFQAGLLLSVLVLGTFVAVEGENLAREMGLVEGKTVLVFVVPAPESAERIRSAVARDRVVWEGEAGFALVGERVVTSSLDRAGDVIEEAGWIDRPIQVVTLEADMSERDESEPRDRDDAVSHEARLARLRELVHKPTLTRGEQLIVLEAMNDGIQL